MSCYRLPCLQSAVYRVSELKANSENEQMSTILEMNNYLTGFNLGDFIWDLQWVFAVLGKRWQHQKYLAFFFAARSSSIASTCIARDMSSYCTGFRVGFVFWICNYTPAEVFFHASVYWSYALQLASCWEANMKQLVLMNSRARPRHLFSKY